MPYDFQPGTYHVLLKRTGDLWYKLTVTAPSGAVIDVGSLKLTSDQGIKNFTFTTEAYAMKNVLAKEIPYWHVITSNPRVNGVTSSQVMVQYPKRNYPFGRVSISSSSPARLDFEYGGRSHRSGGLTGVAKFP